MMRTATATFRRLSACVLLLRGLAAASAAGTGPIRIAGDYPHSFQYQNGERFFPMGDTACFLIAQRRHSVWP
jgi:hypothetical protein